MKDLPMLRRLVVTLVVVVSVLPLTAGPAVSDPTPGDFVGIDGLSYAAAPAVVLGLDDELFFGPDFDVACGVGGRFKRAVRAVARLARVIERSGRRVVFTIAPNKSSVLTDALDPSAMPHGSCDDVGLSAQDRVLDSYQDPAYLPLREALMNQRRQMYFKSDLHWTSVGASVFAKALASRLDPRLGRRQHYAYSTATSVGGLNQLLHSDVPETSQFASPDDGVSVRSARGSQEWSGSEIVFDHSWVSSPARRTWPGHTLLMGDSFTFVALQNLRPVFRHGRFVWLGHVDPDDLLDAIRDADTVVIESVQIFTPGLPLASNTFRRQLRRALR